MISVAIYTLNDRDDCNRLVYIYFFTFKLTCLSFYLFILFHKYIFVDCTDKSFIDIHDASIALPYHLSKDFCCLRNLATVPLDSQEGFT